MSAHPKHGTKPQAAKIRLACDWGEGSGLAIWKIRHRMPGDRSWSTVTEIGEAAATKVADQLRSEGKEVDMSRL